MTVQHQVINLTAAELSHRPCMNHNMTKEKKNLKKTFLDKLHPVTETSSWDPTTKKDKSINT